MQALIRQFRPSFLWTWTFLPIGTGQLQTPSSLVTHCNYTPHPYTCFKTLQLYTSLLTLLRRTQALGQLAWGGEEEIGAPVTKEWRRRTGRKGKSSISGHLFSPIRGVRWVGSSNQWASSINYHTRVCGFKNLPVESQREALPTGWGRAAARGVKNRVRDWCAVPKRSNFVARSLWWSRCRPYNKFARTLGASGGMLPERTTTLRETVGTALLLMLPERIAEEEVLTFFIIIMLRVEVRGLELSWNLIDFEGEQVRGSQIALTIFLWLTMRGQKHPIRSPPHAVTADKSIINEEYNISTTLLRDPRISENVSAVRQVQAGEFDCARFLNKL